jgi:hypothetical protein
MSASRFCENCGATLVAKARFCEACGRAVSALSALTVTGVAAPSSATPRPSQRRWLIIGGVAIVVVIACVAMIAVGGFFFFQSTAQGPTKPAPSAFGSPSTPTPLVNTSPLVRTPAIVAATLTIPAQRTMTGAQPTYSSVTFSSGFDQSALVPINSGKTFPYGATIIYAYWTYSGVVPDTSFDYDWYRNGAHIGSDGEKFINASGKSFQWRLHPNSPNAPKIPLDPGSYTFVLRVGGQVILSDTFVIQAPPDTIVVFFSILNDWPVGYVVDKQGVRHTPMGPILDFPVAPGDRIIFQTDQPRFSLLFDCGTSPKTFTPCDFVADTPAGLPAEIRKNASGTADLHISRADNWAGTRSNFPAQRYPADPVVRIRFGD